MWIKDIVDMRVQQGVDGCVRVYVCLHVCMKVREYEASRFLTEEHGL